MGGPVLLEHTVYGGAIGQVADHERHRLGRRVVVEDRAEAMAVGLAVEHDDRVAARHEGLDYPCADAAERAGNDVGHDALIVQHGLAATGVTRCARGGWAATDAPLSVV